MSCGRVMMLGDARVGKRFLEDVLDAKVNDVIDAKVNDVIDTTATNQCFRRVLQDGTFCTISDEEEMKELALSAYKFMQNNPGTLLNTISSSKLKVIKAFYDPSTPSFAEVESAEDVISDSVKKVVTRILMKRDHFGQNDRPRTSVLLNASSFSSEDTWDILPLFLTPRTLSFLVFDASLGKRVDEYGEDDRKKYCKIIVLIYSSLQKKAETLHKKLKDDDEDPDPDPYRVPYPQTTICGMDDGNYHFLIKNL